MTERDITRAADQQPEAGRYAQVTLTILDAMLDKLGGGGIEAVQAALSAEPAEGPISLPDLVDASVRTYQRYGHLRHRKELLRNLGYHSLSEACPAIADAYAELPSVSPRLRRKVVAGEVGIIGLLEGRKPK